MRKKNVFLFFFVEPIHDLYRYICGSLYTLPVRALPNLPSVILCRYAAAYQLATDGLISLNFHTLAIIIIIIVYTHTCCANISPSCGFYDIKTFISHICCKERKKNKIITATLGIWCDIRFVEFCGIISLLSQRCQDDIFLGYIHTHARLCILR